LGNLHQPVLSGRSPIYANMHNFTAALRMAEKTVDEVVPK
jgi:hypothetical protein